MIMTILIACMLIACSKSEEETPATADLSGYYEFMMPDDWRGGAAKFYQLTFVQNGNTVTGDIPLNDSGTLVNGIVSGTLSNSVSTSSTPSSHLMRTTGWSTGNRASSMELM